MPDNLEDTPPPTQAGMDAESLEEALKHDEKIRAAHKKAEDEERARELTSAVTPVPENSPLYEGIQAQQRREAEFRRDLGALLNRHSRENASNTPDFLLAEFLATCLAAWDSTTRARSSWYGKALESPAAAPTEPPEGAPAEKKEG